jgi:hypothetical protein
MHASQTAIGESSESCGALPSHKYPGLFLQKIRKAETRIYFQQFSIEKDLFGLTFISENGDGTQNLSAVLCIQK